MTSTTAALRFAAQTLEALPGLPPSCVVADADTITITFRESCADARTRAAAVDMLRALLGAETTMMTATGTYGCWVRTGDRTVYVFAPNCRVEVPA